MSTKTSATLRLLQSVALMLVMSGEGASQVVPQEVHPTKGVFADFEQWPAIARGELALANFRPFRAVYERSYQDVNGRPRTDRVVITAERVAWGSEAAIMVTLIDTGSLAYDDTSPRTHVRIFAETDQRMLYQISPAPGTPRDFLMINTEGSSPRVTRVNDSNGEAVTQTLPVSTPQLGAPALWIVGSMQPSTGRKLRFGSADLPAASNILGAREFMVVAKETVGPGPAGRHEASVVNYPLGMTNARVMQNVVIDRPPYLVSKRPMDLASGEVEAETLRLIEFTTFAEIGEDAR